jgi:hypothetical protein
MTPYIHLYPSKQKLTLPSIFTRPLTYYDASITIDVICVHTRDMYSLYPCTLPLTWMTDYVD